VYPSKNRSEKSVSPAETITPTALTSKVGKLELPSHLKASGIVPSDAYVYELVAAAHATSMQQLTTPRGSQ
jgi:hypothetical protein